MSLWIYVSILNVFRNFFFRLFFLNKAGFLLNNYFSFAKKKKKSFFIHTLNSKYLSLLIGSWCLAWVLLNFVLFQFPVGLSVSFIENHIDFFKAQNFFLWSSCRMRSFPDSENVFISQLGLLEIVRIVYNICRT